MNIDVLYRTCSNGLCSDPMWVMGSGSSLGAMQETGCGSSRVPSRTWFGLKLVSLGVCLSTQFVKILIKSQYLNNSFTVEHKIY